MPKRTIVLIVGALILIGAFVGLLISRQPSGTESDQLAVAATIFPVADIARNVAGDTARVEVLLPPGASPHLFEFSPRQIRELQGTKIIFAVGHGLDDWALTAANALESAEVATVDEDIPLRQLEAEDEHDEEHGDEVDEHEHEHEHANSDGLDPHYWLSLDNAASIADNIAAELARIDPANAATYQANAAAYQQQLSEKQAELRNQLKPLTGTKIVTLHDAWGYFADSFGLTIAGVFEPSGGREPTPRFLRELQEVIDQEDISIIFSEPQLATSSLQNFARDNNLGIAIIDPLGGVPERDSFIELMEFNAAAVRDAISQR